MRVLFCTLDYPPSAAGGAEQQARLQAEELVRKHHSVDVVCRRTPGHASGGVDSVMVHRLPHVTRGPYALRLVTYLIALAWFLVLHLRDYDLVHIHLANLQADVGVAAARLFGRPSLVKVAAGGPLGEIARHRRVSAVTRYFGLRHADIVQALSTEIVDDLLRIGVQRGRIRRIPNGVLTLPVVGPEERAARRRHLGLSPSGMIVVFAGRMERAKGVHDLLDAWQQLSPANATLLLLGSPGLKEPVSTRSLPAGAEYVGWTDRVARYLEAADVFVLPSYAEGMSNALLEAMAVGLPCVTTRVGASGEMIANEVSGLLVGPGDVSSLVAALRRLIDDPALRQRLAFGAHERVLKAYSVSAVVNEIEEAYQAMVGL